MGVRKINDAWWVDYYYHGKRRRQKIGSVKREAEEAYNKIKVKIAAGEFILPEELKRQESLIPQPVLFETFAIEEFMPWSQMQHSANHSTRLESIIRNHLIDYMGRRRLSEITPKLIEDYKGKRRRGSYRRGRKTKPLNGATVNRELCCIKVILKKAVEWGQLESNPASGIKPFKETPKKHRLLEEEEIAGLLSSLPDHLYALVACAVYAGLRRSELFYLRWEDINWKSKELSVTSREEHHTKNYQTRRIPMNTPLYQALRRHKSEFIIVGSPYVFASRQRQGKQYTDVRDSINNAAQVAGIEGEIKLHQLRHAFCSHALMKGISPRTVQKWMGHKDLKTTLGYAHVSPDHEKAAIQQLQYNHGHYMDTKTQNR